MKKLLPLLVAGCAASTPEVTLLTTDVPTTTYTPTMRKDGTIKKHEYHDNIAPTTVTILDQNFNKPINSRYRETRLDFNQDGKEDAVVICWQTNNRNGSPSHHKIEVFTDFYGKPEKTMQVWYNNMGTQTDVRSSEGIEAVVHSLDVVRDYCGELNPSQSVNYGVFIK